MLKEKGLSVNAEAHRADYCTVFSRNKYFLYHDPPFKSERSRLHVGRFDHDEIDAWLKKQRGGWALSMNASGGDSDGNDFVPEIYDERFELPNWTSAIRRLSRAICLLYRRSSFSSAGWIIVEWYQDLFFDVPDIPKNVPTTGCTQNKKALNHCGLRL